MTGLSISGDRQAGNQGANTNLSLVAAATAACEYGHGSVLEGLKRIRIEQAMVIGVSTDILFPLQQQEQIAEGLQAAGARVEFVALDSPQGHDAFLVDIDNYSRAIGGFLNRLAAA